MELCYWEQTKFSLKGEVFGPVVQFPEGVKSVGYEWVFVWKLNEKIK